jgi:hypothetical protein
MKSNNWRYKMENLVNIDVKKAYTGEDGITLTQALARIAAEFYDPSMVMDRDSGTYQERNSQAWSQKLILQGIGNAAYRQLNDTAIGKDGRPRGIAHQLDRARNYAKSLVMRAGDTEIDLEALNRAADWIERLEAEVYSLQSMFTTAAAVYECVTGEDFSPYAPWETTTKAQPQASSAKADAVKARLAILGIDVKVEPSLQTNGVETNERDVA